MVERVVKVPCCSVSATPVLRQQNQPCEQTNGILGPTIFHTQIDRNYDKLSLNKQNVQHGGTLTRRRSTRVLA